MLFRAAPLPLRRRLHEGARRSLASTHATRYAYETGHRPSSSSSSSSSSSPVSPNCPLALVSKDRQWDVHDAFAMHRSTTASLATHLLSMAKMDHDGATEGGEGVYRHVLNLIRNPKTDWAAVNDDNTIMTGALAARIGRVTGAWKAAGLKAKCRVDDVHVEVLAFNPRPVVWDKDHWAFTVMEPLLGTTAAKVMYSQIIYYKNCLGMANHEMAMDLVLEVYAEGRFKLVDPTNPSGGGTGKAPEATVVAEAVNAEAVNAEGVAEVGEGEGMVDVVEQVRKTNAEIEEAEKKREGAGAGEGEGVGDRDDTSANAGGIGSAGTGEGKDGGKGEDSSDGDRDKEPSSSASASFGGVEINWVDDMEELDSKKAREAAAARSEAGGEAGEGADPEETFFDFVADKGAPEAGTWDLGKELGYQVWTLSFVPETIVHMGDEDISLVRVSA